MRLRRALTIVSVAAICIATLRATGNSMPAGWSFSLTSGDKAVAELIQNLLLFVPFGLALALRPGMRWRNLLLAGVAISFTVEFLQQWIPGRDPSVGDIVTNAISTLLGGALVWTAPRWLHPPEHRAPWLSLGAAAVAAVAWLGTGWLLAPLYPPGTYSDSWMPDQDRYSGRVLSATLGPLPLHESAIGGGVLGRGRSLLAAGEPLRIVAVLGRPPERRATLLVLSDETPRDILRVGVIRTDLFLVYRTRAASLTLDRPDLRAPQVFAAAAPGDTVRVVARRAAPGRWCLNAACGLGYTVGDGWKLIFFPEAFPRWALRLLNAMWVGAGMLGIGLWGRRHPATGVAVGLVALVLLVGPGLVGLLATPLGEMAGGVAGVGLGNLASRRYRALKGHG